MEENQTSNQLVERLRNRLFLSSAEVSLLCSEAATEIERLQAECDAWRNAFAGVWEYVDGNVVVVEKSNG